MKCQIQDLTFHANCLHLETVCMKCQILFSGKNKKNISKCHLLKILPRVLGVKQQLNLQFTNIFQFFLEEIRF